MKNFLKIFFQSWNHGSEKEAAKVFEKIHPKRKGKNSSRNFEFERARKTNSTTL